MYAADQPAICAKQDHCNELGRTKLLAAFQKALLAQQTAAQAQNALQQDIAAFQAAQAELAKQEAQPEGTTYTPDINAGTVTAQPPVKKAKPEEKKPESEKK